MAFTALAVDGTAQAATTQVVRLPLGNRYLSIFLIDEVAATGSSVDLTGFGVGTIDAIFPSAVEADEVGMPRIRKNSITDSATQDDPGKFWIEIENAGTPPHDYYVLVVYKPA